MVIMCGAKEDGKLHCVCEARRTFGQDKAAKFVLALMKKTTVWWQSILVQASEQASPLASVPKVITQSLKQSESSKSAGKHSSGTASQVSPQASSSSRRPSQTSSASSCFVSPFTATIKCLLLSQSLLCLCSHVNEE